MPKSLLLRASHRHTSTHKHDSNRSRVYNITQTYNVYTGCIVCGERHLRIQQRKLSLLLRTIEVPFCSKLKLSSCVQTTSIRYSTPPNHHFPTVPRYCAAITRHYTYAAIAQVQCYNNVPVIREYIGNTYVGYIRKVQLLRASCI